MPPRKDIVKMLDLFLGRHYSPMDVEDRDYWKNEEDTLVIALDPEDVWRFGADRSLEFACGLSKFVKECGSDEFDFMKAGRFIVLRFWWD